MKSALFAAALLLGGAAIAQEMPDATTPTDASTPADPTVTTTEPMVAPATTTVEPTIATTAAPLPRPEATNPLIQPDNSSPQLDARGIPVISDAATAPAGFNQQAVVVPAGVGGPLVDSSTSPTPAPATEDYPACSRTVTDNCVQTYERQPR